jgi:hypothetical protein
MMGVTTMDTLNKSMFGLVSRAHDVVGEVFGRLATGSLRTAVGIINASTNLLSQKINKTTAEDVIANYNKLRNMLSLGKYYGQAIEMDDIIAHVRSLYGIPVPPKSRYSTTGFRTSGNWTSPWGIGGTAHATLGAWDSGMTAGVEAHAARGLDVTVPLGFPNDAYKIGLNLTSGERLLVIPNSNSGTNAPLDIFDDWLSRLSKTINQNKATSPNIQIINKSTAPIETEVRTAGSLTSWGSALV